MSLLQRVDRRFQITFTIVDNGVQFRGVIDEPPPGEPPAQRFNVPRRLLRVELPSPAEVRQVIVTPAGMEFITSEHGYAERADETLFRAFRLFAVTNYMSWERRTYTTHPVSGVVVDSGMTDMGLIPGSLEADRVTYDKGFEASFPTLDFVTNADVTEDDVVGGMKVIRVQKVLGLRLCVLQ